MTDWLTTQEAADLLGLSRQRVGYLHRTGRLRRKKDRRTYDGRWRWLVSRSSVEAFAREREEARA